MPNTSTSTSRYLMVMGLFLAMAAVLLPHGTANAQQDGFSVVTINGRLLADGVPLSGWTVESLDMDSGEGLGESPADVVTAADGTFTIAGNFESGTSNFNFTYEESDELFLGAEVEVGPYAVDEVWEVVLPPVATVELRVNAAGRPAHMDIDTEFDVRHLWSRDDLNTNLIWGFQGTTTNGVYSAPVFVDTSSDVEYPFFEATAVSDDTVWGVSLAPWNGLDPVYIDVQPLPHLLYWDADGDLYGDPASESSAQNILTTGLWTVAGGDCNDADATINPGATDIADNNVDEDCDGEDAVSVAPVALCNGLPVTINMQTGASGNGTAGADVILGTDGADIINARGGADTICAGDGDDEVRAGNGNDFVDAGAGNDRVFAGNGRDRVIGAGGDDYLHGGAGNDRLRGQDGDDILVGNLGNDRIWGGAGNDRLRGQDGDDILVGNLGNDRMWGGAGQDTLDGRTDTDRLTN